MSDTTKYHVVAADWAMEAHGRAHDVVALEHRPFALPPYCLVVGTTLGLNVYEIIDLMNRHDADCPALRKASEDLAELMDEGH